MWFSAAATILLLSPPPCCPGDLARFPPSIHSEECATYGDGDTEGCWVTGCPVIDPRMNWLKAQRGMHPREWIEWDEQIAEQEQLEETWRLLWRARTYCRMKCYSPRMCAETLQELRDRIGEQDYALGRMPSPIPLHRYFTVGR